MSLRGRTLFEKIWTEHIVADLGDDTALLHIDRHLLHDLGGSRGLLDLKSRGLSVHDPELTFATPDHSISTTPGRADTIEIGKQLLAALRVETSASGIRLFDVGEPGQGIVHVIGPELGLSLPGSLIVCGDSHTCTHGGMGALAFGIGSSELSHVLATQTLIQRRPKTMRVRFEGVMRPGVTAKDLILALIGHVGAAGGVGYAVEYAGSTIRDMPIEGRLTICNLSIELGAKMGLSRPTTTTFEYLKGRPYAPAGAMWTRALEAWRALPSDADAVFDRDVLIDVASLAPQVTWGTSPEHVVGDRRADTGNRQHHRSRQAQRRRVGPGVYGFAARSGDRRERRSIGCSSAPAPTAASAICVPPPRWRAGARSPAHVRAWVVPGSESVKRAAVEEGLDKVFIAAGFEWREPGCSMCLAANGETVPPGQRSVSTSNRNFIGRQGPRARTHLASPATAAAAAIAGAITDVRDL